jgi:hypothetical protein
VELRGQDDLVAATFQRLADDLLRLALGVDVGGVDEVDAGVECRVDDAGRLLVVRVAPRAEHHRAKAHLAHRDARASKQAVVHDKLPSAGLDHAHSPVPDSLIDGGGHSPAGRTRWSDTGLSEALQHERLAGCQDMDAFWILDPAR